MLEKCVKSAENVRKKCVKSAESLAAAEEEEEVNRFLFFVLLFCVG